MIVAAVDIGSTSTRWLIHDSVKGDLLRESVITGLGRDLAAGGRLHPSGVEAALGALRIYAARAGESVVEELRAVATSGLRRAIDGEAFLSAASEILGVRPEIIDGVEEGRLSFLGATSRRDPARGPFVVVDLGGGSCEFSVGSSEGWVGSYSAEFGAARLTEQYIASDPPRPDELLACLSVVEAHLADVRRALPAIATARTWIGVAGTMCTFAAVELGLQQYDQAKVDGFLLSREAAEDVFRTLVTEPLAARVHNPGLEHARAEIIVGGACAVVAMMRGFGLDELMISDSDLLDSVVATMICNRPDS